MGRREFIPAPRVGDNGAGAAWPILARAQRPLTRREGRGESREMRTGVRVEVGEQ